VDPEVLLTGCGFAISREREKVFEKRGGGKKRFSHFISKYFLIFSTYI
jgi:hypothetical protein